MYDVGRSFGPVFAMAVNGISNTQTIATFAQDSAHALVLYCDTERVGSTLSS